MSDKLVMHYVERQMLELHVECLSILQQMCTVHPDIPGIFIRIRNRIKEANDKLKNTLEPSIHCARVLQFQCWCHQDTCPKRSQETEHEHQ